MEEARYKYIVIKKDDLLEFVRDQGTIHASMKYEIGSMVEIREVEYDMKSQGWRVMLYSPLFDVVEPEATVPMWSDLVYRRREFVDIDELKENGFDLTSVPGFYRA